MILTLTCIHFHRIEGFLVFINAICYHNKKEYGYKNKKLELTNKISLLTKTYLLS